MELETKLKADINLALDFYAIRMRKCKEGRLSKDAKKENTGVKDSHTFIYTPVCTPPFLGQEWGVFKVGVQ